MALSCFNFKCRKNLFGNLVTTENLSKSEPPTVQTTTGFLLYFPFQCGFAVAQSEFQNEHQIQNISKSDIKHKKGGIRTHTVRFEMWKIRIILRSVKMLFILNMSHLTFVTLSRLYYECRKNLFGNDLT